ncbi:sensor histidine kinase [Mucilaginibacter sp. JRF]|uniref:sensor histidine kinase n=1 Tax=Mucilaginibacter sp. JRF TaxID=2780088 RepID=UPI00188280B1|nr:histidine kinase [Mucilaginibacter sp. JRF]MBE9586578.1 sensor histidine kinase [Mucilaginibacter sp. JRF]
MLQSQENLLLIVVGTILLLLMGIFIIGFMFFYQRKHNAYVNERSLMRMQFSQEMLKAQVEIQEQTLSHISREIHDNIGQVLSFVKLSLSSLKTLDEQQRHQKIDDNRELITQAISDLRDLSKSLSFERIKSLGLQSAIEAELDRVNKSGLVKTKLLFDGEQYPLGAERELVLFRIFQEGLNNALKYSNAQNLAISLNYSPNLFILSIEDDGVGFEVADKLGENSGSGLRNMESRAAIIGGSAKINSQPGSGCSIKISLDPLAEQKYVNRNHPDSTG